MLPISKEDNPAPFGQDINEGVNAWNETRVILGTEEGDLNHRPFINYLSEAVPSSEPSPLPPLPPSLVFVPPPPPDEQYKMRAGNGLVVCRSISGPLAPDVLGMVLGTERGHRWN